MICPPFLVLAGPTAVGKSEIALLLAQRLMGEIISVDSMQVYRGLDIGTAKPSLAERSGVPHHLIDILQIAESFDVARFAELALEAITKIQSRNRLPILCGGTGLYLKVLFEGLGQAPPSDAVLRSKLEATPLPDLLQELAAIDPKTYERIDRKNSRRVLRAIEVIRLTGKPFSEQRATWSQSSGSPASAPGGNLFYLSRASGDLRRRIEIRVDAMFRQGLVEETEQLLKLGLAENPTASQALGYKQTIEYLRGVRSLSETIELVKIRTRQYAKRQVTWFRHQHRFCWIPVQSEDPADQIAQNVTDRLNSLAS